MSFQNGTLSSMSSHFECYFTCVSFKGIACSNDTAKVLSQMEPAPRRAFNVKYQTYCGWWPSHNCWAVVNFSFGSSSGCIFNQEMLWISHWFWWNCLCLWRLCDCISQWAGNCHPAARICVCPRWRFFVGYWAKTIMNLTETFGVVLLRLNANLLPTPWSF